MTDVRTAACVMLTEDAGVSPRQFAQLALSVETPEDLWTIDPEAYRKAGGLNATQTRKWARAQKRQAVILARIAAHVESGLDIVSCFDAAYYSRLLRLTDPPPRMYRKGLDTTVSRYLFVTGTIDPDVDFIGAAVEAGKALASLGLGVVSTLDAGIEAGTHVGALSQDGAHLVFLPGGHHRIDPPEHVALCEEIGRHGAVVSEYAPDTDPVEPARAKTSRLAVAASHAVFIIGWDSESAYIRRILNQTDLEGTPVFYLALQRQGDCSALAAAGAYPVADLGALDLILQYL